MNSTRISIATTLALLGLVLSLLWLFAGAQSAAQGNTLTVCSDGPPGCQYGSVQEAVDAAEDGDLIQVASGVYTDVHQREGLTQTVYISKSLTVRGGYDAEFGSWDPDTYSTTLDAGGQGRVFLISGTITATVEGLRISGGDAGGLEGGGLYVATATVTISGNEVVSNTAASGGGLYAISSTVTLQDSEIYSNTASHGGGLYVEGSTATIKESQVAHNRAITSGGGLEIQSSPAVTISGSTIVSNTAGEGGGLLIAGGSITLSGNVVSQNSAGSGGGLKLMRVEGSFINNVVADNEAHNDGCGLSGHDSALRMRHNTLARNLGACAAGVFMAAEPVSVTATLTDGGQTGYLTMTNTILVSHTLGLSVTAGTTATLDATMWGTATWANLADWGGTGAIATGTVNIWGEPAFVAPELGDYHIDEMSAAKDSGIDAGVEDDLDGQARPHDGGFDIGADEYYFIYITWLPAVMRDYTPTPIPEVVVVDKYGQEQDWGWVVENFGAVEITRTEIGPGYRVCGLQEVEVLINLDVKITEDEQPLAGVTVIRYWPDATLLPPEMVDWHDRGDIRVTNGAGVVEFIMGPGDKYFPPAGGASAVWVSDPDYPSDLISGLGMLDGTDHIHLNVQYCLIR